MYIYVYVYIYIHEYIYICIHIYKYICMYNMYVHKRAPVRGAVASSDVYDPDYLYLVLRTRLVHLRILHSKPI